MATLYMPLQDEAVEVWAPVQAEPFGAGRYLLLGPRPDDQFWPIPPDHIVGVAARTFAQGQVGLAIEETLGARPAHCVQLCELRLAADGCHRLCLFRRADDMFQYREDWLFPGDEELLPYWRVGELSGLYGAPDEALADAPARYRNLQDGSV